MATIVRPAQSPTRTAEQATPSVYAPRAACGCLIEALEMTQGECSHNGWLAPSVWDAATVRGAR